MKFSVHLEESRVPEWRHHYLQYRVLKERLEVAAAAAAAAAAWEAPGGSCASDGQQVPSNGEQVPAAPLEEWQQLLESNVAQVGSFIARATAGVREKVEDLSNYAARMEQPSRAPSPLGTPNLRHARSRSASNAGVAGEAQQAPPSTSSAGSRCRSLPVFDLTASRTGSVTLDMETRRADAKREELRLLQALQRVSREAAQLRSFVEVNHVALYKILKRHDKLLQVDTGLGETLPRLVSEIGLGDCSQLNALSAKLREVSLSTSRCRGLGSHVSEEVLTLVAGVCSPSGGREEAPWHLAYLLLCFFLGASVALLLAIGVLIALPYREDPQRPFSVVYFLAPFPVFRFLFSVLLVYWGLGAVSWSCDRYNINHKFLLGIDPRCRVGPGYFFVRAAAMTALWMLSFGMYVVDYKWMVFPTVWAARGVNLRSSWHFMLYPTLLLVAMLLVIAWPSRSCRNSYGYSFLRCLGRTASAPFFAVCFCDNIAGDALTSLAKPLQDIPSLLCFLGSRHPQTIQEVANFENHGDVCPAWVHHWIKPLIALLPFALRALQCGRRYSDTAEARHALNLGKYLASLLVVIVASTMPAESQLWVSLSVVATVYAFTWDVALDWGLSAGQLLSCLAWRRRTRDIVQPGSRQPAPGVSDPSAGTPTTTTFFATRREYPAQVNRVFSMRVYWLCACLDLLARLTWVQTLVPVTIVTNDIVQREGLLAFTVAIEIMRRSVWAVIRIEYEQVANAGGFRALLWVPNKGLDVSDAAGGCGVEELVTSAAPGASPALAPLLEAASNGRV